MQKHLRNQRGAALVFELVLVAGVLTLVGLALYQARHHAAVPTAKANTPAALADTTAANAEADAANEVALAAEAESAADELAAADSDVSNLGGSFDANSF
jgi:hypothetical protein